MKFGVRISLVNDGCGFKQDWVALGSERFDLAGDRPHKARQLAGDSDHDLVAVQPPRSEFAKARA